MAELVFEAPDAGIWTQDAAHFPLPASRFIQSVSGDGFVRAFKRGTACYGLLLSHIEPAYVHGFSYSKLVIVGAPKNAKGPPPKLVFKLMCWLHPEIRRRLRTAATVLQAKPWREDIHHWDTVLKPQSKQRHLQLQAVELATLTDAGLVDHLRACLDNSKAMNYQHHVYTVSCAMPVGDFMASTQAWTGLPPSVISQALRGSTPISQGVTAEYLAALEAIAADADAKALLDDPLPPAVLLQRLRALPGATGAAVDAYLDLVSHRVTGGYDITCPTAIETPEVLVQALRADHPKERQAQVEAEVRAHTERIRNAVPAEHRALFDEVLAEARLVNRLRDERSVWSDLWSSGLARHAMLEAGRRLVAAGRLGAAEHALEASVDEVVALLQGGTSPSAAELAERQRIRTSARNEMAPPALNGEPSPPPPIDWYPPNTRRTMRALDAFMGHLFEPGNKPSEGKTVRGIPVSAGTYEGRARVIENIEQLDRLRQGEVLVTPSTSTAFNHVLPLVGAIVTDRGGLMSHAAIVAREYGLPGVVGCQVATRTIPDGARVRVDAERGEVTILS